MLGRRVSACGRTSAFVAGRAATAADLKLLGGRLLAFYGQHEHRKLTISSAQMEVLDGFAGRRAPGAAASATARRTASACGSPRSWPSCASATGSRERDLDLYRYELSEIEAVGARPRRARPSWRPSASGCATPRACARPRPGAHGGDRRRRGGRRRRRRRARRRPRRCCRASPASTPGLDAIAERLAALAVELGDVGARAARLRRGDRGRPGPRSPRSRSGSRRSTG